MNKAGPVNSLHKAVIDTDDQKGKRNSPVPSISSTSAI